MVKLRTLRFLFKVGGIFGRPEKRVQQLPGIQRQPDICQRGLLGRQPEFPIQ
jgi:hypothetical protein